MTIAVDLGRKATKTNKQTNVFLFGLITDHHVVHHITTTKLTGTCQVLTIHNLIYKFFTTLGNLNWIIFYLNREK